MNRKICRPLEHLRAAGQLFPGAWKQFEDFHLSKGKDGLPDWPSWCYVPLAGAYAIVSGGGDNQVPAERIQAVGVLGALAAWRMTRGIYRFDPALYPRLIETPIKGDLPCDLLHHLPEWCVYIESPDVMPGVAGFFAHLEHDANTGREELRLVLDYGPDDAATLATVPLHLGPWSLEEAAAKADQEAARYSGKSQPLLADYSVALAPIISLLLYLCSEAVDYKTQPPPGNPPFKKTKRGPRLFPAPSPTTWDVGVRLGAALRQAYIAAETDQEQESTATGRARPRPHIRVAHWHTYRTGKGRTNQVLRWVPPVAVNIEPGQEIPATIRPVKKP